MSWYEHKDFSYVWPARAVLPMCARTEFHFLFRRCPHVRICYFVMKMWKRVKFPIQILLLGYYQLILLLEMRSDPMRYCKMCKNLKILKPQQHYFHTGHQVGEEMRNYEWGNMFSTRNCNLFFNSRLLRQLLLFGIEFEETWFSESAEVIMLHSIGFKKHLFNSFSTFSSPVQVLNVGMMTIVHSAKSRINKK